MKKSILTIALLIGLSAVGFASTQPVLSNSIDNNTVPQLTKVETQLLEKLNKELEVSLEEILESMEVSQIEKVLVYNAKGELILAQEFEIDLDLLPNNASLLMTEGNTQYYIAFVK